MDKNISGALPLLSSVFLIFFQTQLMRFQILDMNTDFQKTDTPWSDTYTIIEQSDGELLHPVSYSFTIGEENWIFEVTPKTDGEILH